MNILDECVGCIHILYRALSHRSNTTPTSSSPCSCLRMFEEKVGDQAVKAYFESMDRDVWDAAQLSMARMAAGSMKIYGLVNGDWFRGRCQGEVIIMCFLRLAIHRISEVKGSVGLEKGGPVVVLVSILTSIWNRASTTKQTGKHKFIYNFHFHTFFFYEWIYRSLLVWLDQNTLVTSLVVCASYLIYRLGWGESQHNPKGWLHVDTTVTGAH